MIRIKNKEEIKILETGGKILAEVLDMVAKKAQIGISTKELDDLAEKLILEKGGVPAFKGYGDSNPYPATLCTSVNNEIVHSIPGKRILQDGDIIGIDIGMKWPNNDSGLYTDCATTVPIGNVSQEVLELLDVTKKSLYKAISIVRPGAHVSDIGETIEDYVNSRGDYGIVRDLVGHGVGHQIHEDPKIPNYKQKKQGEILKEGMVLAIEPMINLGTSEIKFGENGWDVLTKDDLVSAHFEHTVVVTEKGCKILTEK